MIQALEMNLVSKSQNDSRLKSVSLLTGSAIVVFVGLLFAIPSLLFTLGFTLSVYPFYVACAGLCYGFFKMRNYFPAVALVGALVIPARQLQLSSAHSSNKIARRFQLWTAIRLGSFEMNNRRRTLSRMPPADRP